MACQMEHGLPPHRSGVKVLEIGPWQIDGETWQYDYQPVFTDECDLCKERVGKGKTPTCVKHCQAFILEYGEVDDLVAKMNGWKKRSLIVP